MELEDLEPRKKPVKPKDLSSWAVAELEAYIANLEGEIARARMAIEAKRKHRAGVEGLFKS